MLDDVKSHIVKTTLSCSYLYIYLLSDEALQQDSAKFNGLLLVVKLTQISP